MTIQMMAGENPRNEQNAGSAHVAIKSCFDGTGRFGRKKTQRPRGTSANLLPVLAAFFSCSAVWSAYALGLEASCRYGYVTNGLVAHWDVLDNAATGVFNANSTDWIDLVRGIAIANDQKPDMAAIAIPFTAGKTIAGFPVDEMSRPAVTIEACVKASGMGGDGSFNIMQVKDRAVLAYNTQKPPSAAYKLDGGNAVVAFPNEAGKFGHLCYNTILNGMPANAAPWASHSWHTYTGVARMQSCAGAFDGISCGTGFLWQKEDAGKDSLTGDGQIGFTVPGTTVSYRSVRVYSRELTADEIRQNRQADEIRFLNMSVKTIHNGQEDGLWSTASDWSDGVPSTAKLGYLYRDTSDPYVVALAEPAETTSLYLRNRTSGVTLDLVSGGSLSMSNSILDIGSNAVVQTGEGGALTASCALVKKSLLADISGVLKATGGDITVRCDSGNGDQDCHDRLMRTRFGGKVELSGSAVMNLRNGNYAIGTGSWRFSGSSVFNWWLHNPNGGYALSITPENAGETASLIVEDDATYKQKSCWLLNVNLGSTAGGLGRVTYDTTKSATFGATLNVGTAGGRGELNIARGLFQTQNQYGDQLVIGRASETASDTCSTGVVNVTGGRLVTPGGATSWFEGINIGLGATTKSNAKAYGELNVSGGTVTNGLKRTAFMSVGLSRGVGRVNQTGGEICHYDSWYALMIGAFGGRGMWSVSNGVTHVRSAVYVGGITKQMLVDAYGRTGERTDYGFLDDEKFASGDHSAVGEISVSAGTFVTPKAIRVSCNGSGTLTLGPCANALIQADEVDLSRTTATDPVRQSTVRFTFGEEGTGLLKVTGGLTVAEGSKLYVDFSAYKGELQTIPLITYKTFSGTPFAPENIRLIGKGDAEVRQMTYKGVSGYYLKIRRGLVLVVR